MAFGEAAAVALPVLSARHVASQLDGAAIGAVVAGGAVATALSAALSVGVGTLIRHQAGAIITALAVLYVLEPLLSPVPATAAAVQRFGVGGLASGAAGTTGFPPSGHLLPQAPAALILGVCALAVLTAGAVAFRRRDLPS